MIKFIGSVILILCGIICGVEKSLKYIKHVEFLKDYFEFLMDLKNQINYSQCSIFNVINKFKTRKFIGKYFEKFEKIIKVKSFEFAWRLSFENIRKTFDLSVEEELFILYCRIREFQRRKPNVYGLFKNASSRAETEEKPCCRRDCVI